VRNPLMLLDKLRGAVIGAGGESRAI